MQKYFKEKEAIQFLLSEYLKKDASEFEGYTFSETDRLKRTAYLMSILKDVPLTKDLYVSFIRAFQSFGGMYDVRTKVDTIKGIYKIIRRFPMLSAAAIDEIWFRYIKDLFSTYFLEDVLERYLQTEKMQDATFEHFLSYVDQKASEYQERFIEEAYLCDELYDEYSESFVLHIKMLILRRHHSYDEIKKYLPGADLIQKDEAHLMDLSMKTGIFFGVSTPLSYQMFDILLEEKSLDMYPEVPGYLILSKSREDATFTKTEFLESIHKRKM